MPSSPPRLAQRAPTPEDFAFSSLTSYAVYQWPGYRPAPHQHRIARALERVERGECRRLMICMPPRHGKSMLASEYFPAWYLGRNPDRYVIHATYAQELAEDFGRKVRNQMADPAYAAIFPGVGVRSDSASAKRFNTTRNGVYYALGVGGPATGRGAHLLLIDDPIKGRQEADSETVRRQLKDWYTSVAYTRLMPDSAIVLINTRWHEDDLSGWQLREFAHEGWELLSLPAIDDRGRALWPSDYPLERLEQIKRTVGSRDWTALYQQRPVPQEGGVLKLGWFERYTTAPAEGMIVQSWDTAYKPSQINDPSVCTTWRATPRGYHLLHVWRGHVDFPTLKRTAINLAGRWKPDALLVEDKASGQSLIQELRNGKKPLPVIAIEPEGDKLSRANAVSPMIEAGTVFLPEVADWLVDYEAEISTFPLASNDDQVDSTTQALAWMRDHAIEWRAYGSGQTRAGLQAPGTGPTPSGGLGLGSMGDTDTSGFL
jgi:predicted phage terminase large subunit-like protein